VGEAAFALIGILVGVAITSGFSFWSVQRGEHLAGAGAIRALDDELAWLSEQLAQLVAGRRVVPLDAAAAVAVWRERREALVFWVKADTSLVFGRALRDCECWAAGVGTFSGELAPSRIEEARALLAELEWARTLLASLAAYLESQYSVFILVTAWRGMVGMIKRRLGLPTGWQPPVVAVEVVPPAVAG